MKPTIFKIILTIMGAFASGAAEVQVNDEMTFWTAIASLLGGAVTYYLGRSLHKATPPAQPI